MTEKNCFFNIDFSCAAIGGALWYPTPEAAKELEKVSCLCSTTLSMTTFGITTLSIKGLHVTLSIKAFTLTLLCHYAEIRVLLIVMLNAVMLSVVMLNVIMLSVVFYLLLC